MSLSVSGETLERSGNDDAFFAIFVSVLRVLCVNGFRSFTQRAHKSERGHTGNTKCGRSGTCIIYA